MLNAKQEKFVENLINGMSQREAYKDAYNAKYKDEAIDSKASALFNLDKVQVRYRELLDKVADKAIMSAKQRMKWLSDVVNGNELEECKYYEDGECHVYQKSADLNTKIRALDTLNKMTGEYIQKVEVGTDKPFEVNIKVVE